MKKIILLFLFISLFLTTFISFADSIPPGLNYIRSEYMMIDLIKNDMNARGEDFTSFSYSFAYVNYELNGHIQTRAYCIIYNGSINLIHDSISYPFLYVNAINSYRIYSGIFDYDAGFVQFSTASKLAIAGEFSNNTFISEYDVYDNQNEIICHAMPRSEVQKKGKEFFSRLPYYIEYDYDNPVIPQDEYLIITLPQDNFKTIDKQITYWVNYSIFSDNVDNLQIKIQDNLGNPIANNLNVESYDIISHTTDFLNGYQKGYLRFYIKYRDDFTGTTGVNVKIIDTLTGKSISDNVNIQLTDFIDSNNDGIDDITGEDQYQNLDEELILITKPGINSKTSSKLVPLNFTVKIKANDYNAVQESINILYLNPLTNQYENLLESDIIDWNGIYNSKNQLLPLGMFQYGEYITLNYTVNLLFNSDYIGKVPLRIEATSNTTNKTITQNHNFEIIAFVDANGDGIDDNTWEDYDPNPQLPDYGDDDLSLEDSLVTVKKSIPFIKDGLLLISSLITVTLSFLPPEVMALIISIITILGVTTIIKLIRG